MVIDDVYEECKNDGWLKSISQYIFMFWDGLGFFGTDITKLERLKKVKDKTDPKGYKGPKWYDKFKSCQWFTTSLILISISIHVIRLEIDKLGTVEIVNKDIAHRNNFTYGINETLPLLVSLYFQLDEISTHLNKLNTNTPNWKKLPDNQGSNAGNLKDWQTHTPEQKDIIEKFLCDNTRFSYHQSFKNFSIGMQPYSNLTEF